MLFKVTRRSQIASSSQLPLSCIHALEPLTFQQILSSSKCFHKKRSSHASSFFHASFSQIQCIVYICAVYCVNQSYAKFVVVTQSLTFWQILAQGVCKRLQGRMQQPAAKSAPEQEFARRSETDYFKSTHSPPNTPAYPRPQSHRRESPAIPSFHPNRTHTLNVPTNHHDVLKRRHTAHCWLQ